MFQMVTFRMADSMTVTTITTTTTEKDRSENKGTENSIGHTQSSLGQRIEDKQAQDISPAKSKVKSFVCLFVCFVLLL